MKRAGWRFALGMAALAGTMTGAAAVAAEGAADWPAAFEGAQWLRDPVFEDTATRDFYGKQTGGAEDESEGPENVHTYFRKEIELEEAPVAAFLHVTGDDYYKLYINGGFQVQGPAPSYPYAHPYHTIDVTDSLRAGANALAAHAYYQGKYNRVWYSADNRSGFLLALEVEYADGRRERFTTDDTWRCQTSAAFKGERLYGYGTQFSEDIDMRAVPRGWREPGFDDAAWVPPLIGAQDHTLVEASTPPLMHWRGNPMRVVKKGEGHWFYDFGSELVGAARIRIEGPAGQVIEVRHGEELNGENEVLFAMRAGCTYQEYVTLSGEPEVVEFYDYKAFRYMEVLHAPVEPEVWVDVRHHPFDPDRARFESSNDLLDNIWNLCSNGIQLSSQGVYVDCPSREKGQYLGDALIMAQAHLLLTGDSTLAQKSIRDFAQSRRFNEALMGVAPASFNQEIAEYSLLWTVLLSKYYWLTGDLDFTREMAEDVFPGLYGWFAEYENEHGLIEGMDAKWLLVDWPGSLRDGYDYQPEKENAVLNAIYYESLRTAAALQELLGEDGDAYAAKAARVKAAFQARMPLESGELFADHPGSEHASLHANALPLAFGLAPDAMVPHIVELIREKRLSCGLYIAPFVIQAAYRGGAPDLAYSLIDNRDERSWGEMLRLGATAPTEAWNPTYKGNMSWCHGWGSSPIYLLVQETLGLRPKTPGWDVIEFAPNRPAALTEFDLTFCIPSGQVRVQYDEDAGYRIATPPAVRLETEAEVEHTQSWEHARMDLAPHQRQKLRRHRWDERAGFGPAVWIDAGDQTLRIIEDGEIRWQTRCATGEKGLGSQTGSYKTPLGWHEVAEKFGDEAPWGQVFRARSATNEVWEYGDDVTEDLVLTRVLWLDGLEPGKNAGGAVDSKDRYIYIHGTNGENRMGEPSSHGCIRMMNDAVIAAYAQLPVGTKVLITE